MTTAQQRHQAALHRIEQQIGHLRTATLGPWEQATESDGARAGRDTVIRAGRLRVLTVGQTRPHHTDRAEVNVALVVELRNNANAQLEGRLRILERHAPHPDTPHWCTHCTQAASGSWGDGWPRPWPCPDWTDAACEDTP